MRNVDNAGTSAAAGLVPGAGPDRFSASNAVVGECVLSRKLLAHDAEASCGGRTMFSARQSRLVEVLTGGAGHNSHDERDDSYVLRKVVSCGHGIALCGAVVGSFSLAGT